MCNFTYDKKWGLIKKSQGGENGLKKFAAEVGFRVKVVTVVLGAVYSPLYIGSLMCGTGGSLRLVLYCSEKTVAPLYKAGAWIL